VTSWTCPLRLILVVAARDVNGIGSGHCPSTRDKVRLRGECSKAATKEPSLASNPAAEMQLTPIIGSSYLAWSANLRAARAVVDSPAVGPTVTLDQFPGNND